MQELQESQGRLLPSITEDGVQFLANLELPDVRELAGLMNWLVLKLPGASGDWTAERLQGLMGVNAASGLTLPSFLSGSN